MLSSLIHFIPYFSHSTSGFLLLLQCPPFLSFHLLSTPLFLMVFAPCRNSLDMAPLPSSPPARLPLLNVAAAAAAPGPCSLLLPGFSGSWRRRRLRLASDPGSYACPWRIARPGPTPVRAAARSRQPAEHRPGPARPCRPVHPCTRLLPGPTLTFTWVAPFAFTF